MKNYRKTEITDCKESNVQDIIQDNWSENDIEWFRLDLLALSRLIWSVDNIIFELMVKKP